MPLDSDPIEHSVLVEIVSLHPTSLTLPELILRMQVDDPKGIAIQDSVQALKRSGLVRENGVLVEPTHAALCAAAIFQPS